MAGYCTCCGGSGFRRPAQEKSRIEKLEHFVESVADATPLDTDFQAQEGCDGYNELVKQARRLRRKQ